MSKPAGDPFARAYAAIVAGDQAGAIAMFRVALALQPRANPLAWLTLSALLRGRGELGEAAELLVHATQTWPLQPKLSVNLCTTLRAAGRYDEARVEAERSRELLREGRIRCTPYQERTFEACV